MRLINLLTVILVLLPNISYSLEQESILGRQIGELVGKYQNPEVQVGLFVKDIKRARVIYSKNTDLPLIPASNLKILTSYVALTELGPQFRFKTQLLGEAAGVPTKLKTLTLRGMGDPTLRTEDLWKMAGALRAQGIREVDEVRLDDSYFTPIDYPGRMKNNQIDAPYNAPVSPLSIDQNLVTLVVRPGEKEGNPVRVSLDPPLEGDFLVNSATTQGRRPKIRVRNIRSTPEDMRLEVKGTLPLHNPVEVFDIAQTDPTQMTGLRFLQALNQFEIQAPPRALRGTASPNSKLLYEHLSPPLSEILNEVNKNSNNFVTEQILKVMGARQSSPPGTTQKGTALLKQKIIEWGLPLEGILLENGSGLSRNNLITVRILGTILERAYQNTQLKNDFLSSLSVLGVDGTLKDKFFDKGLEWYFRGKTGTLNGVTSLSGYIFPKNTNNEGPFVIAFIANGKGEGFWKQHELQQKLLELLINQ